MNDRPTAAQTAHIDAGPDTKSASKVARVLALDKWPGAAAGASTSSLAKHFCLELGPGPDYCQRGHHGAFGRAGGFSSGQR